MCFYKTKTFHWTDCLSKLDESGTSSAQIGDRVFASWLPGYASLPLMVDSLQDIM